MRIISPEHKTLYHSAAVFASNLVVGLYEESVRILLQCGFSKEEANMAINPLFIYNAQKIVSKGSLDALTGPVERNDIQTIGEHLIVLSGQEREIYCRLSNVLADIAESKHKERSYDQLRRLIQEGSKENEKYSGNI